MRSKERIVKESPNLQSISQMNQTYLTGLVLNSDTEGIERSPHQEIRVSKKAETMITVGT